MKGDDHVNYAHYCVIDAQNAYKMFVLVLLEPVCRKKLFSIIRFWKENA